MSEHQIRTGTSFDRFVNFTDAVVAIAITLLVLPLISVAGPAPGQTVWGVLGDNFGAIFAFLLGFFLVARNWLTHNRIVNSMRGYDETVFWLNIFWIAGIVTLPWATAMYGAADEWGTPSEGFGGTGLFFFALLAFVSAMAAAISMYVDRHPELLRPEEVESHAHDRLAGRLRGLVFTVMFLIIGVLTIYFPSVAAYLPLLFIPTGFVISRLARRRAKIPKSSDSDAATTEIQ